MAQIQSSPVGTFQILHQSSPTSQSVQTSKTIPTTVTVQQLQQALKQGLVMPQHLSHTIVSYIYSYNHSKTDRNSFIKSTARLPKRRQYYKWCHFNTSIYTTGGQSDKDISVLTNRKFTTERTHSCGTNRTKPANSQTYSSRVQRFHSKPIIR